MPTIWFVAIFFANFVIYFTFILLLYMFSLLCQIIHVSQSFLKSTLFFNLCFYNYCHVLQFHFAAWDYFSSYTNITFKILIFFWHKIFSYLTWSLCSQLGLCPWFLYNIYSIISFNFYSPKVFILEQNLFIWIGFWASNFFYYNFDHATSIMFMALFSLKPM